MNTPALVRRLCVVGCQNARASERCGNRRAVIFRAVFGGLGRLILRIGRRRTYDCRKDQARDL